MAIIDLTDYTDEEGFVLHFGGRPHEVNTYTFANALVAFSDAYRELNDQLYHGQAIELRLEALGPGSFRGKVKGIRKGVKGLLAGASKHFIIPIFVAFFYDQYLDTDDKIRVDISDDRVVIEHGNDRIIVPREAYNQSKELPNPERLRKKIGKTIEAVEEDDSVDSVGVARHMDDPSPMIDIPREEFARMRELSVPREGTPTTRVKSENAILSIIKAVFSDQGRKWDFVWNGVKISAYIADPVFIADLMRRVYTVGNGDAIECILEIDQEWEEAARVWLNVSYSVARVIRYIPAPENPSLFDD